MARSGKIRCFVLCMVFVLLLIFTGMNSIKKPLTLLYLSEEVSAGSSTGNNSTSPNKTGERRKSTDYMNVTLPEPRNLTMEEIINTTAQINKINEDQVIFNLDKFGPVNSDTFVMVVQVHTRYEYLRFLLQSLSLVDGIENALIIFSHDVFSPEMNEVIQQRVDFVRTMQIFLPFTHQLYPERFRPILDYGHLMSKTLPKHHWWWKANFVFGKIRVLQNHNRIITFIEEDDYALPDFIYMMKALENLMRENKCHGCDVIVGGHCFYGLDIAESWNRSKTALDTAMVTNHTTNRALAFNRTMWHKFKGCGTMFCQSCDNLHWDYSLMHVSIYCLKSRYTVLTPEAPRMFHTGDCGWHYTSKVCNPVPIISGIKAKVNEFKSKLFPSSINVTVKKHLVTGIALSNKGEWANPSDNELCLSFSYM